MAKGLMIPVGVDKSGGAALEDDPQHLSAILKLALQSGDDDNPFQELGLDESIIYSLGDPSALGRARANIERIVNKYSDRVTLDPAKPIEFSKTEEGKVQVSFGFINLDTNTPEDFTTTIG